jgi:hypothetical protein
VYYECSLVRCVHDKLAYKFITSVNGLHVSGLYVAGVMVVSMEGHDISESLGHSESWNILSPGRHSLSARRYSRIAAENGVLNYRPHDKWWTEAPLRQAMELIDGVSYSSL